MLLLCGALGRLGCYVPFASWLQVAGSLFAFASKSVTQKHSVVSKLFLGDQYQTVMGKNFGAKSKSSSRPACWSTLYKSWRQSRLQSDTTAR